MMINRRRCPTLMVLIIALGAFASSRADEPIGGSPVRWCHSVWLGPQNNTQGGRELGRIIVEKDNPVLQEKRERHVQSLEIELQVVEGSKLKLPPTKNGYVTLVNGAIGGVESEKDLRISQSSHYVVATGVSKESSRAFYELNLQITEGPLQGAIVQLRDGSLCRSNTEPYVAVYRIPHVVEANEGPLAYKVVRTRAK